LTDFYCEPEKITAFKPIKKPINLQCFDSNVLRFKDENEKKPGPGDYNSGNYYEKHHQVGFCKSTVPRFQQRIAEKKGRSDSYIEIEEGKEIKKESFSQYPAIFGSGAKRFIENKKVYS